MPPKVAYVYPNSRTEYLRKIEAGTSPDTVLWGRNHIEQFGVEARIHESRLRARERRSGVLHRITWNLRELGLPWELGDADCAISSLTSLFPLTARLRRKLGLVALNFSFCTQWDRSPRAVRALLAQSMPHADRIVCIAQAQMERLQSQVTIDPRRVQVVLHGTDERFWRPTPLPDDGYVLAVGRDLARDYATFLEAVGGLDVPIVMATKPENLAGLKLPPNLTTYFDIPATQVRELYAGAACVVIPTRGEDFPYGAEASGTFALLEGMAVGRPVVVTERGDRADYIRPGVTALTVQPEDVAGLRAAIERVLGDRALAESLGTAGRTLIEEHHTTTRFARDLADIVKNL